MVRVYVLTRRTLALLKGKGIIPVCCHPKCGKPLKEGDLVVSKPNRYGYKRYHYSCWKKTFID